MIWGSDCSTVVEYTPPYLELVGSNPAKLIKHSKNLIWRMQISVEYVNEQNVYVKIGNVLIRF